MALHIDCPTVVLTALCSHTIDALICASLAKDGDRSLLLADEASIAHGICGALRCNQRISGIECKERILIEATVPLNEATRRARRFIARKNTDVCFPRSDGPFYCVRFGVDHLGAAIPLILQRRRGSPRDFAARPLEVRQAKRIFTHMLQHVR